MILSFKRVGAWIILCLASVMVLRGGAAAVWREGEQEGVKLPVLMYHHVLKDSGSWGKFVISPEELEQDLKYLSENGYQTVTLEELVRYTGGEGELPAKPILLTVDDGYLSAKEYIAPLLQKYQMRAVLSVIGTYSDQYTQTPDDNVAYAHLTWEDIAGLSESGVFEIENHTYDMHKNAGGRRGSMIKKGETAAQYGKALEDDLMKTQQKIEAATGKLPICYTYPYGFISKESHEPVKQMGFQVALTCNEGVSCITRDPESLFLLKRINRPHGKSAQELLSKFG